MIITHVAYVNFMIGGSNVCNVRVNGEIPCRYKTMLDDILKYPKNCARYYK